MNGIDKEVIWHNGFRLLNLPITASNRKVSRKFGKIEGMMNLNELSPRDPLPIKDNLAFPVSPDPNFINFQGANTRLTQSRSRFIEEIFWFWPEDLDNKTDETIMALKKGDASGALSIWQSSSASNAKHNMAVYNLVLAIDNEVAGNTSSSLQYWESSMDYWYTTLSSSDFKNLAKARVRSLNDPTIKEDYVDEVFNDLPYSILSINVKFALDYYNNHDQSNFKMHTNIIKNSGFDQKEKQRALDDIFNVLYKNVSNKFNEFDEGNYEKPSDTAKIENFLDSIKEDIQLLKENFGDKSDFRLLGDTIALRVKSAYVKIVNTAMEKEDIDEVLSIDYKSIDRRFGEIITIAYTEDAKDNIKENHNTIKEIVEYIGDGKTTTSRPSIGSQASNASDAVVNRIGKFVTNIDNMNISDAKSYVRDVEDQMSNLSGNHDNISDLFAMSLNAFFNNKARGALEGNVDEFVAILNDLMQLLRIAEAYATESKSKKDIRENIDFAKQLGARDPGTYTKKQGISSSSSSSRTTTTSSRPSTPSSPPSGGGGSSKLPLIIGCVFWIIIIIVVLYFLGIIKF